MVHDSPWTVSRARLTPRPIRGPFLSPLGVHSQTHVGGPLLGPSPCHVSSQGGLKIWHPQSPPSWERENEFAGFQEANRPLGHVVLMERSPPLPLSFLVTSLGGTERRLRQRHDGARSRTAIIRRFEFLGVISTASFLL